MKRIYLLLVLLVTLASNAIAQKDLEIIQLLPDTILYNAGGAKTRYIMGWGFKNAGTTAFTSADTLMLKTPLFQSIVKLSLPASGIPAGDTVYLLDTFGFTAPPTQNPYNWCDSVWFKTGTAVQTEPIGNNKKCTSVRFLQDPLTINNLTAEAGTLNVYPNPATSVVKIQYNFGNNANATVVVRDLVGRVVYQQELGKNISGVREFPINLGNLNSGLYVIELNANDKKAVTRVTIQ